MATYAINSDGSSLNACVRKTSLIVVSARLPTLLVIVILWNNVLFVLSRYIYNYNCITYLNLPCYNCLLNIWGQPLHEVNHETCEQQLSNDCGCTHTLRLTSRVLVVHLQFCCAITFDIKPTNISNVVDSDCKLGNCRVILVLYTHVKKFYLHI